MPCLPDLELVTGRTPLQCCGRRLPDDAPRLVAMFERCSPAVPLRPVPRTAPHFPAAHLADVVRSSPIRRSWVIDDLDTGDVVGVGSWFRNERRHRRGRPARRGRRGSARASAPRSLDTIVASARAARGITTLIAATAGRVPPRPPHAPPPRPDASSECEGYVCTMHVSLVPEAEALAG